jgi:hypothetical protein
VLRQLLRAPVERGGVSRWNADEDGALLARIVEDIHETVRAGAWEARHRREEHRLAVGQSFSVAERGTKLRAARQRMMSVGGAHLGAEREGGDLIVGEVWSGACTHDLVWPARGSDTLDLSLSELVRTCTLIFIWGIWPVTRRSTGLCSDVKESLIRTAAPPLVSSSSGTEASGGLAI